ncbi:ty3-gypsy retrotransposon protein [Cucumis melo var. makuwa]|uniref:Ty3-gypsy retrotransposon protein n=1 Tax=Cucumis melo var. makuwa TaxID=1194695 RepID=A0A5D3E2G3_CUCMM|nr:ty3-gypsy retrotransposon protein [Cucumis melo var. makuwa]TYK29988.1 ty3-gypsy retrotransposon protein [Cucumis melo var. makuwa]
MVDSTYEGEMVEVSPVVELSLNSVVGLTAPGTFKIKGTVENQEIVIMVDCGATHNFISLKLVENLKLPLAKTTNYGIIMGSGKAVQGRGMCKGITVDLPVISIVEDFLSLELGNIDMVILKGDPSLTRMEISLKVLVKTCQPDDQGFLVNFRAMGISKADRELVVTDSVVMYLNQNLNSYNRNSVMYLKCPTVCPRCDESTIGSRIIRPSTSPFSSPVILVKKKDGGWRFCVDYRAFNRATVPDKFPIPMIDELLDELSGASIFSKIDLKSGYGMKM